MKISKKIFFLLFSICLLCIGFFLGQQHARFKVPHVNPSDAELLDHINCHSACCDKTAPPLGRWHKVKTPQGPELSEEEQKRQMQALQALGYASGSVPASQNNASLTAYVPERCYSGVNLYISGHAPEAILMDMQGKELHRWHYAIDALWPEFKSTIEQSFWRRVRLFENGDLLAIYDGVGLIKIDKNSRLLWKYAGGPHHDMDVTHDGSIYVITRKAHILPQYHPTLPILEDFVAVLDSQGNERRRISLLKALETSVFSPLLQRIPEHGDILHTNTIQILDSRLASKSPAFKAGNILLSVLNLDAILVLDPETKKIVWAQTGMWAKQHEPSILENGHMLIFDNRGLNHQSRVLEFDPFTQEVFWEYRGTEATPFYSFDCSTCERLPNGNTLIVESSQGRVFEVTPEKEIVWEFRNPYRAGQHRELIATIFDLIRLRPDFPLDWISK